MKKSLIWTAIFAGGAAVTYLLFGANKKLNETIEDGMSGDFYKDVWG